MKSSPSDFDDGVIRAATFVRHVEIHDTLGSTNDRAVDLARETTIELPALVIARHQTAGRGRGKNSWWSADGALTFSLLIEPATFGIRTYNWPQLSLATAVAICDALIHELGVTTDQRAEASPPPTGLEDEPTRASTKALPLGIKWPNDIMLGGCKVAGILIESPGGAAPAKDRLVIGIGINVNNSWHDAPHDIRAHAVALCDATGKHCNPTTVLINFLDAFERRARQLATVDDMLPQAWKRLCILSGHRVSIVSNGATIKGLCEGIDNDGALLIETSRVIARVYSGSLSLE